MTPKEKDNALKSARRRLTNEMDARGHLSAWSATGLDFESKSGKLVRLEFFWQPISETNEMLVPLINRQLASMSLPLVESIVNAINEV